MAAGLLLWLLREVHRYGTQQQGPTPRQGRGLAARQADHKATRVGHKPPACPPVQQACVAAHGAGASRLALLLGLLVPVVRLRYGRQYNSSSVMAQRHHPWFGQRANASHVAGSRAAAAGGVRTGAALQCSPPQLQLLAHHARLPLHIDARSQRADDMILFSRRSVDPVCIRLLPPLPLLLPLHRLQLRPLLLRQAVVLRRAVGRVKGVLYGLCLAAADDVRCRAVGCRVAGSVDLRAGAWDEAAEACLLKCPWRRMQHASKNKRCTIQRPIVQDNKYSKRIAACYLHG